MNKNKEKKMLQIFVNPLAVITVVSITVELCTGAKKYEAWQIIANIFAIVFLTVVVTNVPSEILPAKTVLAAKMTLTILALLATFADLFPFKKEGHSGLYNLIEVFLLFCIGTLLLLSLLAA
jgi:hypothetical protein